MGRLRVVREPIAERVLELREKDGRVRTISVATGKPYEDGDDWACDIRALHKTTQTFYGVDALQALTLALKALDVQLWALQQQYGSRLTWLGSDAIVRLDLWSPDLDE